MQNGLGWVSTDWDWTRGWLKESVSTDFHEMRQDFDPPSGGNETVSGYYVRETVFGPHPHGDDKSACPFVPLLKVMHRVDFYSLSPDMYSISPLGDCEAFRSEAQEDGRGVMTG